MYSSKTSCGIWVSLQELALSENSQTSRHRCETFYSTGNDLKAYPRSTTSTGCPYGVLPAGHFCTPPPKKYSKPLTTTAVCQMPAIWRFTGTTSAVQSDQARKGQHCGYQRQELTCLPSRACETTAANPWLRSYTYSCTGSPVSLSVMGENTLQAYYQVKQMQMLFNHFNISNKAACGSRKQGMT